MMADPIQDFLKYARSASVRAHSRIIGGKSVPVSAHSRDVEDDEVQRTANLRARQQKELELWRTWKEGGMQQKDLKPLLRSFKPMIKSKANVYAKKVRIPPSAIEMTFQIEFVNALRSYDPSKGSLGTYVYKYLDKGKRWIAENQNVGRIPENRVYKIRKYQDAVEELKEELGRPPEYEELSQRLGWSLPEIDRMDSELRSDLVTQGFEEDPYSMTPSKSEEVLKLFKYELSGEQKQVYAYLTGYGKPKTTSTSEIAKKLKMKDYQVSRVKNQIYKKLRRYIEN
jgi:DNA-directed RNA polymerase specialized sigma subunit